MYYHKVLEAKLVLGDKIIISLGTEFIENEKEDVSKQDCELNAAKRLLKRIKQEYPKLPVCTQGDVLYVAEPVMELCRKNGWKYIFSQKETRQRLAAENYNLLSEEDKTKKTGIKIGKEEGTGCYYNHIEKLAGKKEIMNVYEYSYLNSNVMKNHYRLTQNVTVDNLPKRISSLWNVLNNRQYALI